jgi:predicted RNA-binding protein YlxR (DUF448 family)
LSNRAKADPGSERTCIVTRAKGAPEAMIRFVLSPETEVVADLRHKLPGRGVWVSAQADTVADAVKRKTFARAFKEEVRVSASLPMEIEVLLRDACLQALSLAKKAGQVVAGSAKVEAAIKAGGVIGLVHAGDGSADGSRKLSQALRRKFGGPKPEIKLFTSLQLSLALGGTNVIHAALTEGTASETFLSHCRRLERYCSTPASAADLEALEATDDGAI